MKQSRVLLYPLLIFILAIMACNSDGSMDPIPNSDTDPVNPGQENPGTDSSNVDTSSNGLKIIIGTRTFNATLVSNPTVTAFKARLPMTVNMTELNGNEKLYNFSSALPANASNPRNIATGDLMLYGSATMVLFYESFPTSYSYTRLGKIDNPSGLAAAVGNGSVSVRFELE
ncbi:MAG: cyclophilin-like fold protein [Dyadobacter sp.]|uniref:cyclophilin-like fold protein n=1 Tax=Dyadobacter sp. TaxID=1914288 RepID=UPI003263FAA5